jgi:lysophospholipase L1-like esterase
MRRALSIQTLFLFAFTPLLHAQQPEVAPVMPTQTAAHHDAPLNPALPTVFIVGDSTARNNADLGWGDHFAALFDTTRINVANRAVAGRSSRTYYNEGRWTDVLKELKSGDFVLIQMGHNDGGGTVESVPKDAKGRSSLKGLGDETVTVPIAKPYTTGPLVGLTTETVHTYGWYIGKYIADARAKGATPILLTVTVRNIWKADSAGNQHIERDMGYRDLEYQLGETQHVPVVDMATLAADRFEALGPDKTAKLFPIDHTHTSAIGAGMNADAVAQALRQSSSPLAAYLKPTE